MTAAQPLHGQPQHSQPRPPRPRPPRPRRPPQPWPPQRRSRPLKRVCHIASGACAATMIATVLAGCGGPAAAYRASVVSYTAPAPGDLNVSVSVTNIGTAAGTPTCTIDAKYQSGAGAGSNTGELSGSLAPGRSSMLDMLVAIPAGEIGNVTKVSATC